MNLDKHVSRYSPRPLRGLGWLGVACLLLMGAGPLDSCFEKDRGCDKAAQRIGRAFQKYEDARRASDSGNMLQDSALRSAGCTLALSTVGVHPRCEAVLKRARRADGALWYDLVEPEVRKVLTAFDVAASQGWPLCNGVDLSGAKVDGKEE